MKDVLLMAGAMMSATVVFAFAVTEIVFNDGRYGLGAFLLGCAFLLSIVTIFLITREEKL